MSGNLYESITSSKIINLLIPLVCYPVQANPESVIASMTSMYP